MEEQPKASLDRVYHIVLDAGGHKVPHLIENGLDDLQSCEHTSFKRPQEGMEGGSLSTRRKTICLGGKLAHLRWRKSIFGRSAHFRYTKLASSQNNIQPPPPPPHGGVGRIRVKRGMAVRSTVNGLLS